MISFVKGEVADINLDSIVVETGGMGFQIFAVRSILENVNIGDDIKVYTYMNVREDDISLYGFPTKDDLTVFKQLLSVSGIGPKVAIAVLSTLSTYELRCAVMAADHKTISKVPGVGPKTAQRVVIELKDKLDFEEVITPGIKANSVKISESSAAEDAIEALTELGYSRSEAMMAVKACDITEDMKADDILKLALKRVF